jgi:hypothetical protein
MMFTKGHHPVIISDEQVSLEIAIAGLRELLSPQPAYLQGVLTLQGSIPGGVLSAASYPT